MRRKHFTLLADLSVEEVIGRLAGLFEAGGATAVREGNSIRSVQMPLPLLNIDPRMHSRRNRIGLNPFALASAIEATVAQADGNRASIDVRVDRLRMLVPLPFEVALILFMATDAPLPAVLIAAFLMLGLTALLLRWSHTLLRFEMKRALIS